MTLECERVNTGEGLTRSSPFPHQHRLARLARYREQSRTAVARVAPSCTLVDLLLPGTVPYVNCATAIAVRLRVELDEAEGFILLGRRREKDFPSTWALLAGEDA
eukprot:COSAG02_NODE_5162_length_4580_cov_4.024994_4_plen_104_part_01